jgi:hypothetical protein
MFFLVQLCLQLFNRSIENSWQWMTIKSSAGLRKKVLSAERKEKKEQWRSEKQGEKQRLQAQALFRRM